MKIKFDSNQPCRREAIDTVPGLFGKAHSDTLRVDFAHVMSPADV